ncbi:hypothetical protein JBE04_39065 [Streptomyces sp. PRKS01-29]|nr:hypothetical protein [Streptomyces sabulosicollis]MBI0300298.1 hypothetical protein [Streptomyces sabulosicollis]
MSGTAPREFWGVAATGAEDAWTVGRRPAGCASDPVLCGVLVSRHLG